MTEGRSQFPEGFDIEILDPNIETYFEPSYQSSKFTIASVIGNLFFYRSGTDPDQKENQVDAFQEGVVITAAIPPEISDHPLAKIRGIENLRVGYLDERLNQWVPFQYQTLDLEAQTVTVRFNFWIKDPNVGWGFL